MCVTHTPADATGSPPSEITASDAVANGQSPAQQEQQLPMMPSHEPLEQSPTPIRSDQTPQPAAPRPQLIDELQQSSTYMVPLRETTAQKCWDKDSQQQQASATPMRIEDATAPPTGQGRDKQTQTTVSHRDAMVQTNTPT